MGSFSIDSDTHRIFTVSIKILNVRLFCLLLIPLIHLKLSFKFVLSYSRQFKLRNMVIILCKVFHTTFLVLKHRILDNIPILITVFFSYVLFIRVGEGNSSIVDFFILSRSLLTCFFIDLTTRIMRIFYRFVAISIQEIF